ncbi:MAG TPA: Xaa-Pro peptidase family protein, partial [Tahibacter sp.]|nr:Xaa-Pro peptidase family protein [Tahibacter sp.]
MTIGVGGNTPDAALAALSVMNAHAQPIAEPEYRARIAAVQVRMREQGIAAIYVNAGTNLRYFTGTRWRPSERMVGAIVPADGDLHYVVPAFEIGSFRDFLGVDGTLHAWDEHESPYRLFADVLDRLGVAADARVGLCESAPFFLVDGVRRAAPARDFVNAACVTAPCRMRKSANEIALMQCANDMTLAVHKAAASILRDGITTTEVEAFVAAAHRKVGASGSYFCIVLFGPATAFPHGVKDPQTLKQGDMVLIDTGCLVHGYMSDITRTYVYGAASDKQRAVWNSEQAAQAAAFAAARIGAPCGSVDV